MTVSFGNGRDRLGEVPPGLRSSSLVLVLVAIHGELRILCQPYLTISEAVPVVRQIKGCLQSQCRPDCDRFNVLNPAFEFDQLPEKPEVFG